MPETRIGIFGDWIQHYQSGGVLLCSNQYWNSSIRRDLFICSKQRVTYWASETTREVICDLQLKQSRKKTGAG